MSLNTKCKHFACSSLQSPFLFQYALAGVLGKKLEFTAKKNGEMGVCQFVVAIFMHHFVHLPEPVLFGAV